MKKRTTNIVLALVTASSLQADWQTEAGDIIQLALPVAALGATYIADDKEGRWMLVKSLTLNLAVSHTVKFTVDKWRPKGQNPNSFPSGHTAAAFGGASFIQTRYGYAYGIPAYALATFVGYSRIRSENHYADDVLAGASLAMMSNWAFTEPLINDITLSATASDDGVKITANMPIGGDKRVREPSTRMKSIDFNPDVRFVFEFGAVWMDRNDIKSPGNTGEVLDFNAFAGTADPTSSIRSGFEFYLDKKNEVFIQVSPYELRATGNLPSGAYFDGKNFTPSAGTEDNFIAYRWNEYRARWRYNLLDSNNFTLKLGAGLSVSSNEIELTELVGNKQSQTVSSLVLMPIAHIHTGVKLGLQSELYAEIDAGGLQDNFILDATIQYRYKMSKHWDLGGGYRFENVRINTSNLYNHYTANNFVLNLGYSFIL